VAFYLSPLSAFLQLLTDNGIPLGGGLLWSYTAGTTTPAATYTDSTGGTTNANPIQMASNGRLPNVNVWQAGGSTLKFVFSTNAGTTGSPVFGTQLGPTFDQITGINDPAFNQITGTFTGSLTGMTGTTNVTVSYAIVGKICILRAAGTGTSNTTAMTMTGVPSLCTPSSGASICSTMLEDNGSNVGGWAQVTTGNTINFGVGINNNQSGFTNSGTKGLPAGWCVTYSLF